MSESANNSTSGLLNYQASELASSLISTGNIYMDRTTSGHDLPPVGLKTDTVRVKINSGRNENFNIDKNGFQLINHKYNHIDYFDQEQIINKYYQECARIVKETTGASLVYAFDHNLRISNNPVTPSITSNGITQPNNNEKQNDTKESQTTDNTKDNTDNKNKSIYIKGGNAVVSPAYLVHNDYTLVSAPRRLTQLAEPPRVNDTFSKLSIDNKDNKADKSNEPVYGQDLTSSLLPPSLVDKYLTSNKDLGKRYCFINLWRNISDDLVEDVPLALCDYNSLTEANKKDYVTFEIRYQDRVGENYLVKYNPQHKWYYFPKMHKDEAILLKVWDSQGDIAIEHAGQGVSSSVEPKSSFTFHSAFKDENADPKAKPRQSMEVRLVAFFD